MQSCLQLSKLQPRKKFQQCCNAQSAASVSAQLTYMANHQFSAVLCLSGLVANVYQYCGVSIEEQCQRLCPYYDLSVSLRPEGVTFSKTLNEQK